MTDRHDADFSAFVERVGGDQEFIVECVELFAAAYPPLLRSVREAVEAGSPARVSATAHALKGMVSNFSRQGPARLAEQLERMGDSGALAGAPELLSQLESEIDRLLVALRRLAER